MSLVGMFKHEIAPPNPIFGNKSCSEDAFPDPTEPILTEKSAVITPASSTPKK